jgi:hypothetical protein
MFNRTVLLNGIKTAVMIGKNQALTGNYNSGTTISKYDNVIFKTEFLSL